MIENILISLFVGLPTLLLTILFFYIEESDGKYISLIRFLINFYISERNKPKDEVDWDTLKGLYRQSVLKNQKLEVWKLSKVFKRYNIQP